MDEQKLFIISPDLASTLLALYSGYKNGTISPGDTTLSQEEFLQILRTIAQKALWKAETEEQIVEELRKIIAHEVEAKATVPGNLKELLIDLERIKELEDARREGKNNAFAVRAQVAQLKKDLRELDRVELPTIDASQNSLKEDVIAEFAQGQDKDRFEQALKQEGIPESAILPLKHNIESLVHQHQTHESTVKQSEIADIVIKTLKADVNIVSERLTPEKTQDIVDAIVPFIRRSAPNLLPPDIAGRVQSQRFIPTGQKEKQTPTLEKDDIRAKVRREQRVQQEVMLLLRQPSDWNRFFGQLTSLGRIGPLASFTKEHNEKQITQALATIKTRYPDYYDKNFTVIQTLVSNVRNYAPQDFKATEVEVLPIEEAEKKLEKINAAGDTTLYKLEVNPQENTVKIFTVPSGVSSLGNFAPALTQASSQAFKGARAQTASKAAIALRELLTNPHWKFPRLVGGGGLIGLGVAFPTPLSPVLVVSGGTLWISQASQSPELMSKAIVGTSNFLDGIRNLSQRLGNFNFKPNPVKAWVWGPALAIGIVVFVIFPLQNINTTQSTFLLETGLTSRQSEYITVSKTTSNTSFQNDQVPDSLPFKITVVPAQGTLTNVVVVDEAKALGRTIDTKRWELPELTSAWTQDYTVTIPAEIKKDLKDTQLSNTVTVTATVSGVEGITNPQISTFLLTINIGTIPDDCPSGWPTATGWINQGPYGTATHQSDEAIDIHGNRGTPIYSTFKGTAYPFEDSYDHGNGRGRNIEVHGVCQGKPFKALYAHFQTRNVQNGQIVNKGDLLGTMDCTGWCTGDHLHYQLRGLPIAPPYIPTVVPKFCVGRAVCAVEW